MIVVISPSLGYIMIRHHGNTGTESVSKVANTAITNQVSRGQGTGVVNRDYSTYAQALRIKATKDSVNDLI